MCNTLYNWEGIQKLLWGISMDSHNLSWTWKTTMPFISSKVQRLLLCEHKCDTIKENGSVVKQILIISFLLHYLITSKCLILMQTHTNLISSYDKFVNAIFCNQYKTKEFEHCFCQILKQYLRHPTHSSWSCHKLKLCPIWINKNKSSIFFSPPDYW